MGNGVQKLYWDHLTYTHHRRPSHDLSGWGVRNLFGTVTCALLFTILLAAGAGELGRRVTNADEMVRDTRGAHLMQDLMDAIAAYPYDKLATLQGPDELTRRIADNDEFWVEVGVRPVEAGVLRVEATLRSHDSSEEIGRFVSYRRQS